MKVNAKNLILLVLVPILAGCSIIKAQIPGSTSLDLKVDVHVDPNNVVVFKFGAQNTGSTKFPGDKDFFSMWELTTSEGGYQASGYITSMGFINPGETVFPAEWKSELAPGEYKLTWSAEGLGSTMVNFRVYEHDGSAPAPDEGLVDEAPEADDN